MLITARFKPAVSILGSLKTTHRVWLNDLDIFGHMNNGRYFTITDLVRMQWLIRSGLWKKMKPLGYYPVMAGETAQFRGSLMPFQQYFITTRVLGWDERFIYVEHVFETADKINALLIAKARILGKRGERVSPREMLELAEIDHLAAIQMDKVLEAWNDSTRQHWQQAT